ncbi:MAG: type II secretion system protein GspG [Planctomycetes bacterium]|nr:type II secretion system protein GspG [Planctomycetota bacterium]
MKPLLARRRSCLGPGGFTLIEVMVVIVILGLLAALIVPNVVQSGDKAQREKARFDCKQIASAARLYFAERGRVPTLDDLTDRAAGTAYLEEISDDPWGGVYEIVADGMPPEFEVRSSGRNQVAGDEDDVSSKSVKG